MKNTKSQITKSVFCNDSVRRIGRFAGTSFVYRDNSELIFFSFDQVTNTPFGLVTGNFSSFCPLAVFVLLFNDVPKKHKHYKHFVIVSKIFQRQMVHALVSWCSNNLSEGSFVN